ncbi:HPr family phosphocarrier protein [Anaerosacchariphilus polymeriproducens]|uniref:Phosphocarrier protein HPr n=1 Tax=Anaerosacchariphilus polymeriproducens TaxID=1812858 RepID=A0A371AYQ1_9FIRM|nr:HPr family phosphocarrier protein [Anaerosacchariphilus polymeriproducens]RDU24686.1 HPr family phosphocarrier protein [Anaerosacchariphilus polymeriproducens]
MKKFEYVIKEPVGIHARPASLLVKEASKFKSNIIIFRDEENANVKRLMSLMALGIKCSETVKFEVEGEDEEIAAEQMEKFCQLNL